MRRLKNISWETQTWVDTDILDIWEITVLMDATFPCSDQQWIYLVWAYEGLFETVYNPGGGWGVTWAINEWGWHEMYIDEVASMLRFKTLVAWAWIAIWTVWDTLVLTNTWAAPTENQVDFADNSTEYIVIWDITTDRVVKVDYSLEWGWNYQEWFMYVVHDGITADMNHEFGWLPSLVSEMNYSLDINGNDIRLVLQSIAVWGPLKFKYKKEAITLTT